MELIDRTSDDFRYYLNLMRQTKAATSRVKVVYEKKKEYAWKVYRQCLWEIERLGGCRAFNKREGKSYKSLKELFLGECNFKDWRTYYGELRMAHLETSFFEVPLCTYSEYELKGTPFIGVIKRNRESGDKIALYSIDNPKAEKARECWQIAKGLATTDGVEVPTIKHIRAACNLLKNKKQLIEQENAASIVDGLRNIIAKQKRQIEKDERVVDAYRCSIDYLVHFTISNIQRQQALALLAKDPEKGLEYLKRILAIEDAG